MKLFLIKFFKIGLIFYGILWLFQLTIDLGLKRSDDDTFYNWNKIYNGEINADIIFFGSSRTQKHYNPQIFEQKLNVNSYNLGSNGANFDIQYVKLKAYLKNNKRPTLIVLNVDVESLKRSPKLYKKVQYLPYFSLDNIEEFSTIDNSVIYEYLVPMSKYRNNLKLFGMAHRGLIGIKENNLKTNKGFSDLNESWNNTFEELLVKLKGEKFNYSRFNLEQRFAFFESMICDIDSSNISLLLVWAPEYIGRQELGGDIFDQTKFKYSRFAMKNSGVEFLDFTKDSICYDKYYFYDSYHLNNKGAKIFSNQVADSIKKYFKQ